MANQALEQTRDSVLRYGESVGCELLNLIVRSIRKSPPRLEAVGCLNCINQWSISAPRSSFAFCEAVVKTS
jgi:hypothetical protein